MKNPTPVLIVTLTARTLAETRSQIEEARRAGADVAEIRLDRWIEEERNDVGALFPSPLPLLVTLRSTAEGGEGPDLPEPRRATLDRLRALPFAWVDHEIERDAVPRDAPGTAPSNTSRWILSRHFTAETDLPAVQGALRQAVPSGGLLKIVVPASVRFALRELLPNLPPQGDCRYVMLTTGPSGALFRVWSRRLGFPIVYGSLPDPGLAYPRRPAVERAQVPIDRLQRYFSSTEESPLFAVVGRPIAHSRSPEIHSRWFREMDLTAAYVPLEFTDETELVDALPALAATGFRGLNVTHPFKSVVVRAASSVSETARRCGCANTLTLSEERVEAENTDLAAIVRRLKELRVDGQWASDELLIVGTGGAARAALAAGELTGSSMSILARRSEPAVALTEEFDSTSLVGAREEPFELVIHATSSGMQGSEPFDLPLGRFLGPGTSVVDFVYHPHRPWLQTLAHARGAKYEDGWRLLVYQAAASFGRWWDRVPSEESVNALIAEGACAA